MTNETDVLRKRFERLLEKTECVAARRKSAIRAGDAAAIRQSIDDLTSGRSQWRNTYRHAKNGMKALLDGNLEQARLLAWVATDYYVEALEKRARPGELAALAKSAQRRGRPKGKDSVSTYSKN